VAVVVGWKWWGCDVPCTQRSYVRRECSSLSEGGGEGKRQRERRVMSVGALACLYSGIYTQPQKRKKEEATTIDDKNKKTN
jgi:hypothetical protein